MAVPALMYALPSMKTVPLIVSMFVPASHEMLPPGVVQVYEVPGQVERALSTWRSG